MSKWIEKKTPPVLPIYFAALVWLVGGIVLPLYRLWALALTALLSAAAKRFLESTQESKVTAGAAREA